MESKVVQGDCLEVLRKCSSDAIDLIVTDPPYGYSFMGKDWDKAVVGVETWKECLRVLKPGAFAFVMSAPRQDVLSKMIVNLTEAGFKTDFTSLYWTYATGFPKAANIGKLVDKRLGVEREVLGLRQRPGGPTKLTEARGWNEGPMKDDDATVEITEATSPEAKALDGSYGGFQPKPAVEIVIVAMKPLDQKTYLDQAMSNGKGVTWLDDARFPTDSDTRRNARGGENGLGGSETFKIRERRAEDMPKQDGRFPANLAVSDGVLGDFSGFFSLDAWAEKSLPFLIVPKAGKREKNDGLDHLPDKLKLAQMRSANGTGDKNFDGGFPDTITKNTHATVKPLTLMSYLITLGSRSGETVLDPFAGSFTTCCAAKMLGRKSVGIEREAEYVEIGKARIAATAEVKK